MLVVACVPLALLATAAAGYRAGFDHGANDKQIGRGLADHDAAGRRAEVGAVEVDPNAVDQLLQFFLAEAGVGAAGAGSGTFDAVLDAAQEHVTIKAARLWMRLEYFLNGHFLSPLSCERGGLDRSGSGLRVAASRAYRGWRDRLATAVIFRTRTEPIDVAVDAPEMRPPV